MVGSGFDVYRNGSEDGRVLLMAIHLPVLICHQKSVITGIGFEKKKNMRIKKEKTVMCLSLVDMSDPGNYLTFKKQLISQSRHRNQKLKSEIILVKLWIYALTFLCGFVPLREMLCFYVISSHSKC